MKQLRKQWSVNLATSTLVAAGMLCASSVVFAKVTQAEVSQLGKTLTCVGAEKAANADGTVAEYTGKWKTIPGFTPKVGQHPVDPYKDEKPLFTISAANMAEYAAHLTPGQKAMFKRYPDTFKMPVYPSHRDFAYNDSVCEAAKKNAQGAVVKNDGMTADGYVGSILFPFPKNGVEAYWNLQAPVRAWTEHVDRDTANVDSDGDINWSRTVNTNLAPVFNPKNFGKSKFAGVAAHALLKVLKPTREKGTVLTALEPTDYAKEKRLAWIYDPGTRRVRQLPEFGFDQPMAGVNGRMVIDEDRLFNGSPERYNWTIKGKEEVFVPYNTFKLHSKATKYNPKADDVSESDLLQKGHANPKYMRYEKHRVWVLEANLKKGYRHIYAKRVIYLDEDTWHAVVADNYDGRGKLWKHAQAHYYYDPSMNAFQVGNSFYHDLTSGSYLGYNLFQERKRAPVINKGGLDKGQFSPEAIRALGN